MKHIRRLFYQFAGGLILGVLIYALAPMAVDAGSVGECSEADEWCLSWVECNYDYCGNPGSSWPHLKTIYAGQFWNCQTCWLYRSCVADCMPGEQS